MLSSQKFSNLGDRGDAAFADGPDERFYFARAWHEHGPRTETLLHFGRDGHQLWQIRIVHLLAPAFSRLHFDQYNRWCVTSRTERHVNHGHQIFGLRVLRGIEVLLERRNVAQLISALWEPAAVNSLVGLSKFFIGSLVGGHTIATCGEIHHAELALRLNLAAHAHGSFVPELVWRSHVRVVIDDADQLHVRPQ